MSIKPPYFIVSLTQEEFDALGEYSCSLPSGTTIGKRWKRNNNAFARGPIAHLDFFSGTPVREELKDDWWMGEYVEDPNPGYIGIRWSKILIRQECEA